MPEKVAVIGMGQMGSGMARRLRDSGLDVIGYDVNADQRARPRTVFRWRHASPRRSRAGQSS